MPTARPLLQSLSPHLFWDVEREEVDPEAHADFLIRRVMERGRREDVDAIWNYYDQSKIQTALVTAPSLSRKTISFFAHQFSLDREAFRAHRKASALWVS